MRTAICDDARNADSHPLVATCVRFFKYLMPEYAAEFAARLRAHVEARLQVHLSAPLPAVVAQWAGLQELYGKRVMPDSLCSLLNGAPGVLEHWVGAVGRSSGSPAARGSRQSLVADVALEVERRCLRSEEWPVIARFWLFEGCVQTLFRWKILDLPAADVLQTGAQQRANNQKDDRQGPEVHGCRRRSLPVGACVSVPSLDQPRDIHHWSEESQRRQRLGR